MSCLPCQQAKAALTKASNIIEGYTNILVNNPEAEKLAEERFKICSPCKYKKELIVINGIQRYICIKCTCPLDAKLRAKDEVCPLGNW